MERIDIAELEDERPNLYMELTWRNVTEAWKLNDTPTGPDSERAGKRTWIVFARGKDFDYIIQSTAGTKSTPDNYITWIHYGSVLDERSQQEQDGYILIDKSKVGRPRRELTDDERQQVTARREAGETINQIAAALHMGTRKVMEVLNMKRKFAELRREAVKRDLWLEEYRGGYLLADIHTNAVALPYPETCTLDDVWDYLKDIEPLDMSDDDVEREIERMEERLQELTEGND